MALHNVSAALDNPHTLEDILTTAELSKRPPRTPDYKAESEALAALAEIMTQPSAVIFQKLVEIAMDLCHAGSSGLSISETFEGADIFRWHATAGEYKQYLGGTMPRNFSPCGVVVDSSAPQLMTNMVQYYPYVSALEAPPVEVLLVPFYLDNRPVGTVWVVAHSDARKFDTEDLRIIQSLTRFASLALQNMAKESRLKTALDAGRMGTWEFDVDGQLLTCSATCNANYGIPANEVLSFQKILTLIHEEDRASFDLILANAIRTASDFEMQYRVIWPDQSIHWIYVRGKCTAIIGGQAKILSGVSTDITNRVLLENTAREAQSAAEAANLAKTEFLANMSHEIRTPMNAIIGLTDILSMSHPLTEKQQQFLATLKNSSDGLLSLINDLLDISKIESRSIDLEETPFSVAELLQDVASMMALRVKEKGLVFTGHVDSVKSRTFVGDPARLRQILLNLCSNAIKFTENGSIDVSITSALTDQKDVEMVCIAVTDTGIGIAPFNIEKIFHKFTQADTSINRKYGGTGLGLNITQNLVEAMGGTIEVESEIGKGSTFKIFVPLPTGQNVEFRVQDIGTFDKSFVKGESIRILLVEDYEPNILVAKTLLEGYGHIVKTVNNGQDAVHKAQADEFDIILMDVQMHGMNGLEATALIRENEKIKKLARMPIIGMTAHAMFGDKEKCLDAGMDDYISKPFNSDELSAMIQDLIASSSIQ